MCGDAKPHDGETDDSQDQTDDSPMPFKELELLQCLPHKRGISCQNDADEGYKEADGQKEGAESAHRDKVGCLLG
jgi:hypothetical protein